MDVALARSPSPQSGVVARFSSLRAFRHPAYVRLWLGAFVSNVGTWMETIAVGVYVTQSTGKAGWTGTVAALMYLPMLVLGPLGGAMADRVDRRRFLVTLTWVQTLLAALLALLAFTGRLSLGSVSALVLLTGCANAVVAPAFSALLSELVPREDLHSAISLSSAQYNLGRIAGPTLAALVMAVGGASWAFVANAISFLAVLFALGGVRLPRPEPRAHGHLLAEIRTGIRVAHEDAGIRTALWLTAAISVLVAPFIGLLPVYAIQVLHRGGSGTSMMASAQGCGAIAAAFLTGTLVDRWGRRRLLERAAMALGGLALLYWLAPSYPLALLGLAALGAGYLATLTSLSTTCMSRVSRILQARVISLYSLVLGGGYAGGLVVLGWSADRFGLRMVMAVSALLFLLIVLWMKRSGLFHEVDGPAQFLGREQAAAEVPTLVGPVRVQEVSAARAPATHIV